MSEYAPQGNQNTQHDDEDVVDADVNQGIETKVDSTEVDSLLDEIDDVLETNAEEFVRSFVQKGGQ